MKKLRKVISGGQTGVDQAALRAARDCGLEIAGWCPPGRMCEAGAIPAEFRLEKTEQERSVGAPDVPRSQRTEWNVRDSDGTLVLTAGGNRSGCPTISAGTEWAMQCAKHYARPLLVCDPYDPSAASNIREWIDANPIRTLNVAGPSERASPGIGDRAYALLLGIFSNR